MNATKRKFNSLIQGLGSRSSPSRPSTELDDRSPRHGDAPSASVPPSPSPAPGRTPALPPKGLGITGTGTGFGTTASPATSDPTKRRRVGALASAIGSDKLASPQISVYTTAKAGSERERRAVGQIPPAPEPKFCPGDRDQLIRRLSTFQELTDWTPKPDKINEIEWAKRGWVCQGKERVRCTLCNKELVVRTGAKEEADGKADGVPVSVSVTIDPEVQEALVNKFAELMVEAHQDNCLWRKRACDDALLRLQLSNPQAALTSLRERYDDLYTRPAFLPYFFNLRLPEDLDLKMVKAQLPPTFFTDPPLPSSVSGPNPNDVALALALTGWQGLTNPRIGPVPNSASCATCLRRLGLWMFKSKEVDEATGQVIEPGLMDYLDPVREHRFFCPWRNPSKQKNPASKTRENKAGWEVLAQTLKNTAYLRGQAEKSNSRSKIFHRSSASVPSTPLKGAAASSGGSGILSANGKGDKDQQYPEPPTPSAASMIAGSTEEEDPAVRDAKDKERWARLRRVKSLFDTKNGKKMRRTLSRPSSMAPSSRPGTAHSTHDADTDAAATAAAAAAAASPTPRKG